MHDIAERITSEDINVLEQSLRFVRERNAQEAERGKIAETRATAMLALLAILAGFIVPLIESVASACDDTKWPLLALFLASLIFLIKGLYYAVMVLGVGKQYRLKVEAVYDLQPLSRVEAIREEIVGCVWECQKAVQPNTEKLFWLHRCQRSSLIAIILFMLFGILLFVAEEDWVTLPLWVNGLLAFVSLTLFVAADRVAEHWGIWGSNNSSRENERQGSSEPQ